MRDDPVKWLGEHIAKGIILREDGWWSLLTPGQADDWEKCQLQWWEELREGIRCRSPRDFAKVDVVNWVLPKELPTWHPWYEEIPIDVRECGTGSGSKANNPLSRQIALIGKAEAIEREWRKQLPATPKLAKPSNVTYDEFAAWHAERARTAPSHDRSSREEDRKAARQYFHCAIPYSWVGAARKELPKGHSYLTRGRRPAP